MHFWLLKAFKGAGCTYKSGLDGVIKWNVRTRDLQKVQLKSGAEAAYMDVLTKD